MGHGVMRFLLYIGAVLLLPVGAFADTLGAPTYFVSAGGQYLGFKQDVVDSATGATVRSVSIPAGATVVPSAPTGEGMKWDFGTSAWVEDADYVAPPPPPPPPPTATEVLQLLVTAGIITQAQADTLLNGL